MGSAGPEGIVDAVPPPGGAVALSGSNGRRWLLRPPADLSGFEGAEWSPLISTLLAHRGARDLAEAQGYLGPPVELPVVADFPDIDLAVERLRHACERGECVAVFGDYDVDGITSTAILTEALRDLGARPLPYLPDRLTEGYGPNGDAIRELHRQGATVLVTVDCGTSAVAEVALANALGMDVLVLDHHEPPDELPEALALVNPKLRHPAHRAPSPDGSMVAEPAAVGVVHRVVHALYARCGRAYDPAEHRALVALGTVCDMVPLVAENRDLVRIGLDALRRTTRPGLRALAGTAGVRLAEADPEMCGWTLGPRLNAAGRMAHARTALDLLLTDSPAEAERLARTLDTLNEQRRDETAAAIEHAEELLTAADRAGPLLLAASERLPSGIVGLVASRLAERHGRPAIAMQLDGRTGTASCRSIAAFDITALLRRHAGLFVRFGGHRAAAGFTIERARLDEVRETLVASAAQELRAEDLVSTIEVDAELPLEAVNGELLAWLQRLGPHGVGNPVPTFLARAADTRDPRIVGRDRSHLQFRVQAGRVSWRAISFGNAAHAVPAGAAADIVYRFRRDDFRGGALQLEVLDLRPAN